MAAILCVEPLSPTYSTLPRLNSIVLLFFILLSPSDSWATKGALAALMVRVATISFHAIALLATETNSDQTFDLDIIGTWVILSGVGVALPLLLGWAPSLKSSKARPLVRIWGVLVVAGAICAYVSLRRNFGHIWSSSCTSASKPRLRNDHVVALNSRSLFAVE